MRIAIIGSGIAGLSAAWLLGRQHHITMFERHARPGMGAFNLNYHFGKQTVRVDVPIRAFNHCHYRNLVKLYQLLGVDMLRTDHSASYSRPSEAKPFFAYRYLDIGDYAIPRWDHKSIASMETIKILRDAIRFLTLAKRDLKRGLTEGVTIAEYLESKHYSSAFVDEVLLPSFAAIGTCSYQAVRDYPAETVIDFLNNGMLFNGIWRAKHGADDAITKMLEFCDTQYCNAEVVAIRQKSGDNRQKSVSVTDKQGKHYTFDHVIIAVQANQIKALLDTEDSEAVRLLQTIPYEKSEVVVHGDTSLAPGHRKNGAPVLFEIDHRQSMPMASICLNKLYPALKNAPELFQTWNPIREPLPSTVLGRSFFERPLVTIESLEAIKKLQTLQTGKDRVIWYSGSYAMPGIPLLESALQSSMYISNRLGADIPWNY